MTVLSTLRSRSGAGSDSAAMSWDIDERLALRFPVRSRHLMARVLALPPDSALRRRVLKMAFRTHGGTSRPASGVFRTPDQRFEGLPDFPFEPHYRNVGELRLAHLDVGEERRS